MKRLMALAGNTQISLTLTHKTPRYKELTSSLMLCRSIRLYIRIGGHLIHVLIADDAPPIVVMFCLIQSSEENTGLMESSTNHSKLLEPFHPFFPFLPKSSDIHRLDHQCICIYCRSCSQLFNFLVEFRILLAKFHVFLPKCLHQVGGMHRIKQSTKWVGAAWDDLM